MKSMTTTIVLLLAAGATGFALRAADPDKGAKKADPRVFELRTYTVPEGKMDALHARFRDITCKYFEKYGMTVVGFWNPTDPKEAKTKLVYLLAHPTKRRPRRTGRRSPGTRISAPPLPPRRRTASWWIMSSRSISTRPTIRRLSSGDAARSALRRIDLGGAGWQPGPVALEWPRGLAPHLPGAS